MHLTRNLIIEIFGLESRIGRGGEHQAYRIDVRAGCCADAAEWVFVQIERCRAAVRAVVSESGRRIKQGENTLDWRSQ